MLRQLRDGAKHGYLKFILLGFMALAVGGLVLTDVGGFFRGGIGSNVVAKGKNIEIGLIEFDKALRRILASQGLSPQEAYDRGLIDQALRSEIQNRIITREAAKIGIRPNDESVTGQITKMMETVPTNGGSKRDALVSLLRSQGVTEGEFIAAVRQELANNLFQNALLSNMQELPLAQAQTIYQFQNETRSFEGFTLSESSVKGVEKPTEEQLNKFYNARKISFAIPETRDITIATLKQDMVAKGLEISDEEIRTAYDDNIDTYKKPEQRSLAQAVLKEQKQAHEVVDAANEGTSLEKAVKNVTGSKSAFLGTNKFSETSLTDNIAEPSFKAEKGATVGPIQTPLGWHVVVVEDIIAPQTTPFDDVKADIEKQIKQDSLVDELIEAGNKMDDQLASGESLETVVAEMGLTTETFTALNQSGQSGGKDALETYQGDKAQILEAAFDFDTGEISPVMEMADGRFVVVRVDDIKPLAYKPFDDVRAGLEKDWMSEQRTLANQIRVEQAYKMLTDGKSLSDVAKEYGTSVKKYNSLNRSKVNSKDLPFTAMRAIFEAQPNAAVKAPIQQGYIIGNVMDIALPKIDGADDAIAKIQEENSQYLAQEMMGQYMISLLDQYKVRINDDLIRSTYAAPVE